jgi:hypothetical protein
MVQKAFSRLADVEQAQQADLSYVLEKSPGSVNSMHWNRTEIW